MATLGSIIARVENELMYQPDLREHRLDIRAVANARYGLLGRERPWPWLRRRAPLWVFPDVIIPNASVGFPGTPNYGSRQVAVLDSALADMTAAGDWENVIRPNMAGAEFGLTDRTLATPGGVANWEDGPFTIEFAETLPGGGAVRTLLHLDPRCTLTALAGDEGTFTLSWPRYLLPADIDVLEGITDELGQPIAALPPGRERAYAVDPTRDGGVRPSWFLEDYGHRPTFAGVVYPGVSDQTPSNADQTGDHYQRANLSIRIAPTLAQSTTGTYDEGTRVRVFWCWWYSNRFGPPSPEAELTIAAGSNPSVVVSGWNNLLIPVDTSGEAYGRKLAIFVSENDSAFYLRGWASPANAGATSFTVAYPRDSAANSSGALRPDGAIDLPRFDRLYPGGPYTYVRLYPRPAAIARYELDYLARPADLLEDTDAPEFPDQYSEILVWATCLGMAERYARGADTTVWQRNYEEWRKRLDQRYMPQRRYPMTKGAHGTTEPFSWLHRENIRYTG